MSAEVETVSTQWKQQEANIKGHVQAVAANLGFDLDDSTRASVVAAATASTVSSGDAMKLEEDNKERAAVYRAATVRALSALIPSKVKEVAERRGIFNAPSDT